MALAWALMKKHKYRMLIWLADANLKTLNQSGRLLLAKPNNQDTVCELAPSHPGTVLMTFCRGLNGKHHMRHRLFQ